MGQDYARKKVAGNLSGKFKFEPVHFDRLSVRTDRNNLLVTFKKVIEYPDYFQIEIVEEFSFDEQPKDNFEEIN